MIDTIEATKVSAIIVNLAKALSELNDNGFTVQHLTADSVLINEASGQVKIVISKSTVQKIGEEYKGGLIVPTSESLRYTAPELINNQRRSEASWSWSIGIMM